MGLNPAMLALIKGAKAKHSRGNAKTYRCKTGRTQVRIIGMGDTEFWADVGVHWIKNESGKVEAVVGCHDHTYEKPCPVCAAAEKAAKASTNDDQLAVVKEWKTKKTVLVNALIRKFNNAPTENPNDPQILELPPSAFTQLLSMMEEYADEYGDVLDPNTGMDFVIKREGEGIGTEYTVIPAPKHEAVPKAALAKLHDLHAYIESEYFPPGKETKALNSIAAVSGITPTISHATSRMLSGPGKIIDADVEEIPAPPKRPAPKLLVDDEPPFDTEEVAEEAPPPPPKKPAAKATAAAAPKKPAPKVEEPADDDFNAALPDDEINSLLDDLDGI